MSIVRLLGAACALVPLVCTASPITLIVGAPKSATPIPADFVGISFETSNLLPETDGGFIFTAENTPLVTLFRNAGVRSLRIGGGTAEPKTAADLAKPQYRVPGPPEIDRLFEFAEAADVRIIYTLRLLHGDKAQNAAIAQYIAGHYGSRLDSFSIGNEPDWHAYHRYPGHDSDPSIYETNPGEPGSAYPSYLKQWRAFAAAVLEKVPDARFSGPDTGSNWPEEGGKDTTYHGRSWTENFAVDARPADHVVEILAHDYVGQGAKGVSVPAAVDAMLSRGWVTTNYPTFYNAVTKPVLAGGHAFRMTECNGYTGGVKGASNAFVAALWALDYLHWQAAHGASGLNFHNNRWIYTDTFYHGADRVYKVNPKAYGLRAFAEGSHGTVTPVTLDDADDLNLTAYAVTDPTALVVTLINKEHGAGARDAKVTFKLPLRATQAATLALVAPDNNPCAQAGVTLGGDTIRNDRPWSGHWTELPGDDAWTITVPPTSALLVRFSK